LINRTNLLQVLFVLGILESVHIFEKFGTVLANRLSQRCILKGKRIMETNTYQQVFTVIGALHGLVVKLALEQAGIPVDLIPSNTGYLDVMVPSRHAASARKLLYPEPRTGEIYMVPTP
jgi:hypothetical protein